MRPAFRALSTVLFTLIAVLFTRAAAAAPVPRSVFTPNASVESFEGIINTSVLFVTSPISLPSGAALQPGVGGNRHAIEDGKFGTTGAYGSSPVTPIPDGTAFIVANTFPGYDLAFTFPTSQHRVGANVAFTANDVGTINLSAYDANNSLIETVSIPSVNLPNWPDNFIGLENTTGIRRVDFSSSSSVGMVLDLLRFETVPEPASFMLLAALAASFFLVRRRDSKA
jgi:PEP-CTERM motif